MIQNYDFSFICPNCGELGCRPVNKHGVKCAFVTIECGNVFYCNKCRKEVLFVAMSTDEYLRYVNNNVPRKMAFKRHGYFVEKEQAVEGSYFEHGDMIFRIDEVTMDKPKSSDDAWNDRFQGTICSYVRDRKSGEEVDGYWTERDWPG